MIPPSILFAYSSAANRRFNNYARGWAYNTQMQAIFTKHLYFTVQRIPRVVNIFIWVFIDFSSGFYPNNPTVV